MLERAIQREIAVVEILDLITDAGATFRGHADKVLAIRREFGHEWRVAGLLVIRGTHRNRVLVRSFAAVMRARYPGPSHRWLAALRGPAMAMPSQDGFAWTGSRTPRLYAARLR
jgi:hypothetical protein